VRPLAATLALALFASAFAAGGPSLAPQGAGTADARELPIIEASPARDADETRAATSETSPSEEEESSEDDVDGDDGELLAMLRVGPSLTPRFASDVAWDRRIHRLALEQPTSDLIRPPIRT
jgi:hypothetical protein